jgi:thioredoxin reductase
LNADVLIVGAGPAGLAAAIELRRLGVGRVIVADRELDAGGVPRHSAHTGYGLRDLHRVMTGPAYARHYAAAAEQAGAQVRTGTTVTALVPDQPGTGSQDAGQQDPGHQDAGRQGPWHQAVLTSAAGIETVTARAVLLATGCRERPRSARLVPGGRPPGIMTTGELQQRVYLGQQRLPGRALVVGAEHVSFSAMVTLEHAGAEVLALVTDQPRQQSYAAFALAAALRWRVPVWTSTAVRLIDGRGRLTAVELADLRTAATRLVECETIVFTGDWIPDHELARMAGLVIDPRTRGPAVDTGLQTSVSSVHAAGNLVHAAETADIAALGGRHAARQIAAALRDGTPRLSPGPAVPVIVAPPLAWISPSLIRAQGTPPPRGRFLLRSEIFARRAELQVRQDDRILATARARLIPGRPVHLGAGWLALVEPAAGPVQVRVRGRVIAG